MQATNQARSSASGRSEGWTAPLGAGFGGPAVSRGKVYLLDRDEKVGDTLRVYDTYSNWQCAIPVGHAVDAGQGRVLLAGGYGAGSALFRVQKNTDGGYEVTELFKNPDFGSHTQPPIVYKDHVYAQYTINERSDGLVCMTMDGQVKWKTGEEPPFSKGGAVLADGLLLAVDDNTKLYLIEPDPAGFKPLANAELLEPGNNWAPIAVVDGKLLIRDQKQLKCVQVAQKARP